MIRESGFNPGGFSEYVCVAPPNVKRGVFHLPENLSFEEGIVYGTSGLRYKSASGCGARDGGRA